MRQRRQKLQDPVKIEINFDPEAEDIVEDTEMKDVRYVKVIVPRRQVEDREGVSLVCAPEGGKDPVCPLKLHGAPRFFYDEKEREHAVEFRAELDVDAMVEKWGSVEEAAAGSMKQPLPFRFQVGIKTKSENEPNIIERPGELRINLNRIEWEWEGFDRVDGKPIDNDASGFNEPITVAIDGTDTHGFRLKLQLHERQENGQYAPKEADFTHYISPAVHEITSEVIAPKPLPWNIEGKASKRQIETTWWSGTLPPESPILAKLPIETTIRVRAYPAKSIKRHNEGVAPLTEPPNRAPFAVREIPLHLGVAKWKLRVITPDPTDAPVLLATRAPGDGCFDVEIEIFDDSQAGTPRLLQNRDVPWRMREGRAGTFPGTVRDGGPSEGTWRTDNAGRVKFRFCPDKKNARLLADPDGGWFHAEFDVWRPGAKVGAPEGRIPSAETPDEKEGPSFKLEWAPAFDFGLFKLPFFIDSKSPLDLEMEPNEEHVASIPLELAPNDQEAYREAFRTGGTLVVNPKAVEDAEGKAERAEAILTYYRLIVGDAKAGGEKPRIVTVDPGTEGSEGYMIEVPAPTKATGAPAKIAIQPEVHLHPDVRKILKTIFEACQDLQKTTAQSDKLPGVTLDVADQQFQQLGAEFLGTTLRHCCRATQEDLIAKRKELVQTLTEMPRFIVTTGDSWQRMGGAIDLHRAAFKRMEENLINAYYDLLLFGPIKRLIETKVIARCPPNVQHQLKGLLEVHSIAKLPLEKVVSHMNKTFIGELTRFYIERCVKGAKEKMTEALSKFKGLDTLRTKVITDLERSDAAYAAAIKKFSAQVDGLTSVSTQIEETVARVASQGESPQLARTLERLTQQRQELQKQLAASARETGAAHRAHRGAFEQRIVAEVQYRAEEARLKSLQQTQKHFLDRGQEGRALAGGEVSQEAAEEFLTKLHKPPFSVRELGDEATTAGQQEMQRVLEGYTSRNTSLAEKVAVLEQDSARLLGRDLTGSTVSGQLTQMTPGDLEAIGPLSRRATEQALSLVESANHRVSDQTVKAVFQTVASINAINSGTIGDALKSSSHVIANEVERFAKGLPAPPTEKAAGIGEGWDVWIAKKFLGLLIYWCTHSRDQIMQDSGVAFLRMMTVLFRILFFPINFLFRVTARLLAKMLEMLLAVVNAIRELPLFERTTALQKNAVQAGLGALSKCGASVDDFFDFPYFRQKNIFDRCIEAERQYRLSTDPLDKNVETILETAMGSGFEDYYPGQMRATRRIFFQLCSEVLSKDTLQAAPCEQKESSWKTVMRSQQSIERQIDQYQNAFQSAGGDQKALLGGGFFNSLVDLYEDFGSWTSKHWDTFIDWVAWIIGIICMIVAFVFSLMAIVGGLLSAAAGGGGASIVGVIMAQTVWALRVIEVSAPIAATLRLAAAGIYFYPYSTAYPRDIMLTQAIYYAAVFQPPAERFQVSSEGDIVAGYTKQTP